MGIIKHFDDERVYSDETLGKPTPPASEALSEAEAIEIIAKALRNNTDYYFACLGDGRELAASIYRALQAQGRK